MKQFLTMLVVLALCSMSVSAQITSAASGNWNAGATWVGGNVPTGTDQVVIANGHTVTINTTVTVASLTIGQGSSGILTFSSADTSSVTVTGNVTIAAGGSFLVPAQFATTGDVTAASTTIANVASTAGLANGMSISGTGIPGGTTITAFTANSITLSLAPTVTGTAVPLAIGFNHGLFVGGNLTNNGTCDLSLGATVGVSPVMFTNTGSDQSLGGTGTTTRFGQIIVNKGAVGNKVNATIDVSGTTVVFTAGTWEQSAGRLSTLNTVTLGTVAATTALNIIGSGSAVILGNLNVFGTLLVNTTDSLLVGTGASKIDFTNVVGAVGTFTKGTVVVLGKVALASVSNVTINGANVIVDPRGFTAGTDYTFRYTTGTGGTNPFTFTSGTVTLLNPNSASTSNNELAMSSSVAANISGSATFVLGQGASTVSGTASGYRINLSSAHKLNHLVVNTGGVPVTLVTNNLSVNGTLTVTSCGTLGGSPLKWTAPRYVFNGSSAQVTGAIMPATVPVVVVNNALGVTSSQALTISDTLYQFAGTLAGPFTAANTVTTGVEEYGTGVPSSFAVEQNYPNPFNPSTSLSYRLAQESFVTLKVYDALGREVATLVNEVKPAGTHPVTWNAAGVGSGVYYYRIQAGPFAATRSMILVK